MRERKKEERGGVRERTNMRDGKDNPGGKVAVPDVKSRNAGNEERRKRRCAGKEKYAGGDRQSRTECGSPAEVICGSVCVYQFSHSS